MVKSASNKSTRSETPLMVQYNVVKAQYRDAILFFRMGDFYEMFYEDARIGARVLGITLTSRGHGKAGNVPLAGFPYHALKGYLAKMVQTGYKVAICEQIEDPKLAKGIVKRDVVQVVTPGTVIEDTILDSNRNNYLSAIVFDKELCGLASADMSTGDFLVTEFKIQKLPEELQSIEPAEILVSENQAEEIETLIRKDGFIPVITKRENWIFQRDYGYEVLTKHFKTNSLKGYGCENLEMGLAAAGAILTYLRETQKTQLTHIRGLKIYSDDEVMMMDTATRRNLEITAPIMSDNRKATLLSILDQTLTPMGARTLTTWIQRPLKKIKPIRNRLDAVENLLEDMDLCTRLRQQIKGINDLERLITKVETKRANPRDLVALKKSLDRLPEFIKILSEIKSPYLLNLRSQLKPCTKIGLKIGRTLIDDPPPTFTEGNLIRDGFNPELDELKELAFKGKDWIARLQQKERQNTGISSLKIGYNKVFGYYIEVTKTHLQKVPKTYIRKQTLVNGERYITPDLKEMEEKILKAEEKMMILEHDLFITLREHVAKFGEPIQKNGKIIGELDCLAALAMIAGEYRYVKPDIHEGDEITIKEGRHPVVEQLLPPGEPFIPNEVSLNQSSDQILIITGPNMAGKSTYIRQVGLIVLMAQIGSFVPASSARIGLVDRIFTRVGAQDNLAGGESTFLVEMNETANILNNATPKSLILLDEIGRGTSTFDGLSIAWAVAEYIHNHTNVQAKTLFATHYHELTELALLFHRVKNYNVAVKEWGEHIVFLRKIVPGGCDHSYGIQVAQLAGLPSEVIERAKEILHNLESNELTPNEIPKLALGKQTITMVAQPQMDLFIQEEQKLREKIKKMDVNALTPLEALQKLDELKKLISDNKPD